MIRVTPFFFIVISNITDSPGSKLPIDYYYALLLLLVPYCIYRAIIQSTDTEATFSPVRVPGISTSDPVRDGFSIIISPVTP